MFPSQKTHSAIRQNSGGSLYSTAIAVSLGLGGAFYCAGMAVSKTPHTGWWVAGAVAALFAAAGGVCRIVRVAGPDHT